MKSQKRAENPSVLYISYTGLLEPLGKSQVYSYLKNLSNKYNISLITFENPDNLKDQKQFEKMRRAVESHDIDWRPLKYHNNPSLPATVWDILTGIWESFHLIREHEVEIIHARSYIPSVIALACKKCYKTRFLFDMRGFWADERIDGNLWNEKDYVYRMTKWFERQFIKNADVVLSLTDVGIEAMKEFSYVDEDTRFEQIPTCTNLDNFYPCADQSSDGPFTLGYVGSVGTWYKFGDVLECFQILQKLKPGAQLHILNKGQHDYIQEKLDEYGISSENVTVESVEHERVPEKVRKMDAGIFFYRQTFSKKGTSPTKMGEFLASGIPCISNVGVGDVESLLTDNDIGVVLDNFTSEEKEEAMKELIELATAGGIDHRCRSFAEEYYSLSTGVEEYDAIYDSLT
ncbi:glycosyltransferase [Halorubrum sp. CGM4_25_10-8A]|uniref:glycosyltransferase n=1 Tax=Halorubrum sp. CGM4_25_10-8A TaxID=2518116 RepID=UPI0010F80453|nr:glycosyltransferase [Halorubrum sp. CGM4_25_10-8A]TKX41338.1 glycosyltransferase [Halorubrum sp. CGM4_25_10-8A]